MNRPTIRASNYAHLFRPAPTLPIRTGSTAQAAPQPADRTAPATQPAPRPTAKGAK